MPRTARVVLPNYPHHVVHRVHNRQALFLAEADYRYYLASLAAWKKRLNVKVYSFCLVTNHVHLILDPGDWPTHLAMLMKRLAGRQTRYANRVLGRTGRLWEGRYKSSPIDSDAYVLACCRYVELN